MQGKHMAFAALGVFVSACHLGIAGDAPPRKNATLLGMLREWQYPGSEMHGAQVSDAAVKDIEASKSKALLTTPDSTEKVMAFYQKKLDVDSEGRNNGQKEGERKTTMRSISIQDHSAGRPLKLYIVAINEKGLSTVLVVSRSESESKTHIAWSQFQHLEP